MFARVLLVGVCLAAVMAAGWAQPELVPIALQDERDLERLVAVITTPAMPDRMRADAAKRLALLNVPETTNALLTALNDPFPEVRRHAARGLGLIGDETTAGFVADLLRDPDAGVREAAALALGWLATPAVLPKLAETLDDPHPGVRLAAVRVLNRLDDPETVPLLRKMAADDGAAGAAALLALARRGDREITPLCLARAAQPDFADLTLALALSELGDPAAVPALEQLTGHADMRIRECAFVGLARIGDTAALDTLCRVIEKQAEELNSTGPEHSAWLTGLKMLPPEEVVTRLAPWMLQPRFPLPLAAGYVLEMQYDLPKEVMRDAFIGPKANLFHARHWLERRQPVALAPELAPSTARFMLDALIAPRVWRDSERLDGLLGPASPPIAFVVPTPQRGCWYMSEELADRALKGRNERDGLSGMRIFRLCHGGGHHIGTAVRGFLAEPNAPVDWYGRGLGVLGDACAVPDLLTAAERAEERIPYGVLAGLMGCADGRHPESYQLLLDAMAAEKPEVRKVAIAALGACREARATPFLALRMKADTVPEVREYCALALGLIGDTRGVSPLCDALKDPVEWARSAAAWALGEIGDPRAVPALLRALEADATPRFQVRVALALYRLGEKDAAATLVDLMGSRDGMTRELAYRALLECNDPRLAGSLMARLAEQPDAALIRALGRQQNPQAVPMIIPVLLEPAGYDWRAGRLRTAAAWALGRIGEAAGIEAMADAARALARAADRDPDPDVRAQAALALARMKDPRATARLEWVMRHYLPERNAALRALWRMEDARATELLAEALEHDDDPLGRVLAARGLALRGDPRGAAGLKALVTTLDERVALQAAVQFAADLRDPALAPAFIRLATAGHEDATIFLAVEVANALASCPAPTAVAALVALLDSPSSRLREAAARGIARGADPAARAALARRLHDETASRVLAAARETR